MLFSESIQYLPLIIFSFSLSTCNRSTYFQTMLRCAYPMQNQYCIVYRFVSERKRQVVIEQTRFLCTVFVCSEFKLENIYSAVNFCGKIKSVCGNLYMWELIFAHRWKNRKNWNPQKFRSTRYLKLGLNGRAGS